MNIEALSTKRGFDFAYSFLLKNNSLMCIDESTTIKNHNAQRTKMDLPIAQFVIKAVQSSTNEEVVLMPSLGGSLPLFLFEKHLATPTITVPIANHDNNQHAENENIRIQNIWNGIETYVALMKM